MNWGAAVVAADRRPSVPEIVVAAVIALIGVLQSIAGQLGPHLGWTIGCAIGLGAAVLFARAFPLPAAALLCCVTIASGLIGVVPRQQHRGGRRHDRRRVHRLGVSARVGCECRDERDRRDDRADPPSTFCGNRS